MERGWLRPGFVGGESSLHPELSNWDWPQVLNVIGEPVRFGCSFSGVSILLTDSEEVWQFPKEKGSKPVKLSFKVSSNQTSERGILKISSGKYHFLSLDEEGKVWGWTDGSESDFRYGRLGRGNKKENSREPKMIDDEILSKHRVEDIECGEQSSFALTSEGLMFGWGWNRNNQVRPGDTLDDFKPFLMSEDVSELFPLGSSSSHIFFRKKGGEIGFCGRNYEGQLGVRTIDNENVTKIRVCKEIRRIKSSEIKSIFSSFYASFILTTEGDVFSAGEGEYSGFPEQQRYFDKLKFPEGEKVIDITCGYEHALFMTSQGRIFICGERKRLGNFLKSAKGELAFGSVFLLPQLSIPEIGYFSIQSSLFEDIPFKLHSGYSLDISLLLNIKFQGLLEEDLDDFEF